MVACGCVGRQAPPNSTHPSFFQDAQSDISHQLISVGTVAPFTDIVATTRIPGGVLKYLASGLDLEQGVTYTARLQAVNEAGLGSTPQYASVTVDTTGPDAGMVTVVHDEESGSLQPGFTNDAEAVQAQWSGFDDAESDIVAYHWALCPVLEHTECPIPWTLVGNVQTMAELDVELPVGAAYRVHVRAENALGLLGPEARSQAFMVDTTEPEAGQVAFTSAGARPGALEPLNVATGGVVDALATTWVMPSVSELGAQWAGFAEQESVLHSYTLCLGRTIGSDDVAPCKALAPSRHAHTMAINAATAQLMHGDFIYASVTATNAVNLTTVAVSEGKSLLSLLLRLSVLDDSCSSSHCSLVLLSCSSWCGWHATTGRQRECRPVSACA